MMGLRARCRAPKNLGSPDCPDPPQKQNSRTWCISYYIDLTYSFISQKCYKPYKPSSKQPNV